MLAEREARALAHEGRGRRPQDHRPRRVGQRDAQRFGVDGRGDRAGGQPVTLDARGRMGRADVRRDRPACILGRRVDGGDPHAQHIVRQGVDRQPLAMAVDHQRVGARGAGQRHQHRGAKRAKAAEKGGHAHRRRSLTAAAMPAGRRRCNRLLRPVYHAPESGGSARAAAGARPRAGRRDKSGCTAPVVAF